MLLLKLLGLSGAQCHFRDVTGNIEQHHHHHLRLNLIFYLKYSLLTLYQLIFDRFLDQVRYVGFNFILTKSQRR